MTTIDDNEALFRRQVAVRLPTEESRELWAPMAQELIRHDGGPPAVKEYLDAQRQALQEKVQRLLDEVDQLYRR